MPVQIFVKAKTRDDEYYQNCQKYLEEFQEFVLERINSQQDYKFESGFMYDSRGNAMTSLLVTLGPCLCRDPKVTVQITDESNHVNDNALKAIREAIAVYGSQYLGHLQIIRGSVNNQPIITLLEGDLRKPPYENDPVVNYSVTIATPEDDKIGPLRPIFRNFMKVVDVVYPDPDPAKEYKYRKPFQNNGMSISYNTQPVWEKITSYSEACTEVLDHDNNEYDHTLNILKELDYLIQTEEINIINHHFTGQPSRLLFN